MDLSEIRKYRQKTHDYQAIPTTEQQQKTSRQEFFEEEDVRELFHHRRGSINNSNKTNASNQEAPVDSRRRTRQQQQQRHDDLEEEPQERNKKKPPVRSSSNLSNFARRASIQILKNKDVVGDYLTNSRLFEYLLDNIFERCDSDKNGDLDMEELYTAILLIHLKLAKHVGPAACSPPSRVTVMRLFNASDIDNSGSIDRDEFNSIVKICCTQIMGRIATYWACFMIIIPILAQFFTIRYDLLEGSWQQKIVEKIFTITFMTILLPSFWEVVDYRMEQQALTKKQEEQDVMCKSLIKKKHF